MFSASNPWRGPDELLAGDMLGKGGEILLRLRGIIADWPRENTAILSHEERHLRFILTVAGYPEVDVATRPFDWPLYDRSVKALQTSHMLDNVVGKHIGTSLRSSLLNRDLNWRFEGKENGEKYSILRKVHEECLLLLFARTRQLDGIEIDDEEISQSTFRQEEESFLGTLHSYDNTRRGKWWPDPKKINEHSKVLDDLVGDPGVMPEGGYGGPNKEEFAIWKEKSKLWNTWKKGDEFTIKEEDGGPRELAFQYHHVQRWIGEKVPKDKELLKGTGQRFLRGASIMLELVVSEVRYRIAEEIGIGSITVDGGGRVKFLCPERDLDKMREKIGEATWQFLTVNNKEREGSWARNNVRFDSTIKNWANACFEVGHGHDVDVFRAKTIADLKELLHERELRVSARKKAELVARLGGDRWRRDDATEWFRQVQSELPSFSVVEDTTELEDDSGNKDLPCRLESIESAQIVKGMNKLDPGSGCWFCDEEENPFQTEEAFKDLTNAELKELLREQGLPASGMKEDLIRRISVKAGSMDPYMGIDGNLKKVRSEICPFHRLLYFLGHDQRLKDSTLRGPTEPLGKLTIPELKELLRERGLPVSALKKAELVSRLGDNKGNRPTTAIARIDANSMGVIFQERHRSNIVNEQTLLDRRRRRCFRFNVHWWQSIQSSVDRYGTGDLVAAWVTAGDDLVLAEYGFVRDSEEGFGKKMQKTLEMLAEEIEHYKEELGEGMVLSIGAGIAIKRGPGDRISDQLPRSLALEKTAKYIWRKRMEKDNPRMMTLLIDGKNEIKSVGSPKDVWGSHNTWENCRIGTTDSTMVVEWVDAGEPPITDNDLDDFEEDGFAGWNKEVVNRILAHPSFRHIKGDEKKFKWLKRHYVEMWPDGSRKLVVLAPKPEEEE